MIRRLIVLLLCCAPIKAQAATTIAVNGSASPITVVSGSTIITAVAGDPGNPGDWCGVYAVGSPSGPGNPQSFKWLSTDDSRNTIPPPPGVTSATIHLVVPSAGGQYEVRCFTNNTFNISARSASITVTVSTQLTKEITWVSGQNLASIPVGWFPQASTIVSMNCRIETPVGATAAFWLVKAPAGMALSAGTRISPNVCDANAASPMNQDLLHTWAGTVPVAVNPGDTIGIATASQAWASPGRGMGLVSIGYTVP